jgi:hypothetical protein
VTYYVLIGLDGLTPASCVSADELEARDPAQCVSTSTETGTKAYTDCRAALASQRAAQKRTRSQANRDSERQHVGR